MRVGLSTSFIGWEEKQLIRAFGSRGIDVVFLDDSQEFYPLQKEKVDYDAVLIRNQNFVRGLCLARDYESLGVPVMNNLKQIELCSNKYSFTLACSKTGLPILPTALAFTKEAGLKACQQIGFPIVIKPLYGGHGNLVALAETERSASGVLESREVLGHNFQKAFYLQKYVPLKRDIRLIIVGKEPLCAIARQNENGWRHNTSQGGKAEALVLTEEMQKVADQLALLTGPGIFGVDLFETDEGLLINEVNHVCQFKNPVEVTETDVAAAICGYVEGVVHES